MSIEQIPVVMLDSSDLPGVCLEYPSGLVPHRCVPLRAGVDAQPVVDAVNHALTSAYGLGFTDGRDGVIEGVATVTAEWSEDHWYIQINRVGEGGRIGDSQCVTLPSSYDAGDADRHVRFIRGALADAVLHGQREAAEQRDAIAEGYEQLQGEVLRVREERDQRARRVTELENEVSNLKHDLGVICEAILEEAERRDWCSEYESFAESVNERTYVWDMTLRTTEVTFTVTLDVSLTRGRGMDSAENIARSVGIHLNNLAERERQSGDYTYEVTNWDYSSLDES